MPDAREEQGTIQARVKSAPLCLRGAADLDAPSTVPTSLDVATLRAPPGGERLLLWLREPGGPGFVIGEATVSPAPGGAVPEVTLTLRPGWDSPDLRRTASHLLDRFLHGLPGPGPRGTAR